MRGLLVWAGIAAALYPLCVIVFYLANVATIFALRGADPLTSETLFDLFLRAAVINIPIAMISALFVIFRNRFPTV
jgi:hypothetical protein